MGGIIFRDQTMNKNEFKIKAIKEIKLINQEKKIWRKSFE
jgi:hypothetical protein